MKVFLRSINIHNFRTQIYGSQILFLFYRFVLLPYFSSSCRKWERRCGDLEGYTVRAKFCEYFDEER
jgi:hypothetical protein